jgi:hypothetical protein
MIQKFRSLPREIRVFVALLIVALLVIAAAPKTSEPAAVDPVSQATLELAKAQSANAIAEQAKAEAEKFAIESQWQILRNESNAELAKTITICVTVFMLVMICTVELALWSLRSFQAWEATHG